MLVLSIPSPATPALVCVLACAPLSDAVSATMRYAIMMTALASTTTISSEALSTRTTTTYRGIGEGPETTQDLDARATARGGEAEALPSAATANRTLRDAREKQHQVRLLRGYLEQRDRPTKRQERKCVICSGPHCVTVPGEARENPARRREARHTQRTRISAWLRVQKRACSQGKHWKGSERLVLSDQDYLERRWTVWHA